MNKKRKILFVINSLYGGGAEKVLQTLLKNINYNKYDITLYSFHEEIIDNTCYSEQINYKYIFKNSSTANIFERIYDKIKGKLFVYFPKIFYVLSIRQKYDVEIAFIEGESTKFVANSSNKKSKKYAWVHVDLIHTPWTDFLYKSVQNESKIYQKFDKILCVSNSVKNAFIKKYGIDSLKVKTQYNPIDQKYILSLAKKSCQLPPKDKLRMIAVGRLVEQKGFDRLLPIINRLKKEGFKFELLILGDGEKKDEFEEYIRSSNLKNTVTLLGFQTNPYAFMKECDCLVCSSRSEGFSTVVAEALIIGVPVISMECAGIYELFNGYECGIITENEENSLYLALKKILEEPSLLNKYSLESIKRGMEFSVSEIVKEIECLFDE